MPQEIYNEGRVVGLSAWEIFKRQALGEGVPETDIPSEREWLSSTIGSGASMILRISKNITPGVCEFMLPYGSNLTAAGVIIASPFMGECEFSSAGNYGGWAKKVISYGSLIANDKTASPTSSNVPFQISDNDYKTRISEYLKITDGIVYTRNAKWIPRTEYRGTTFDGDGTQTSFVLPTSGQVPSLISVTKNSYIVDPSNYSYVAATRTITFNTAPEDQSKIMVAYNEVNYSPAKDIDPNFNSSTTMVRVMITEPLNQDVLILLTGFANKRVLQGLSGYAHDVNGYAAYGSTDIDYEHNHWLDGGMLGPEIIPWASKIVFTLPTASYGLGNTISRSIPNNDNYSLPNEDDIDVAGIHFYGNASQGKVKSGAVIDFNSIDLMDYYRNPNSRMRWVMSEYIEKVDAGTNKNVSQLVAWYPGMFGTTLKNEIEAAEPSAANFFPPALYAAKISAEGSNSHVNLIPLDTAAPGTIKGFSTAAEAANYKALLPDNHAISYNSVSGTYSFAIDGIAPEGWTGTAVLRHSNAPRVTLVAGPREVSLISLTSSSGSAYPTDGTGGVITVGPTNKPNWGHLLQALPNNYSIDVLGRALRTVGGELENNGTIGHSDIITDITANTFTLGETYVATLSTTRNSDDPLGSNLVTPGTDNAYKSGTNFIEFANGLRLYISDTEPLPEYVPEGSIGIGWAAAEEEEEIIAVDPGEPIGEDNHPALGGEG